MANTGTLTNADTRTGTRSRVIETDDRNRERIIDGFFYEPFNDRVTQFTGLFRYCGGEESDAFEGLLQDDYGDSRINGLLLEKRTLNFEKTYAGRPPIKYAFSFDETTGLYFGSWQGADAFNGHASCKLDNNLIQREADIIVEYFKTFDAMTDAERAQLILGHMVGEGFLNVTRDQQGEVMFSLSDEGQLLANRANETMTPTERRIIDSIDEDGQDPF